MRHRHRRIVWITLSERAKWRMRRLFLTACKTKLETNAAGQVAVNLADLNDEAYALMLHILKVRRKNDPDIKLENILSEVMEFNFTRPVAKIIRSLEARKNDRL